MYDIALFDVEDSREKLKQIVEIHTAYLLFGHISDGKKTVIVLHD